MATLTILTSSMDMNIPAIRTATGIAILRTADRPLGPARLGRRRGRRTRPLSETLRCIVADGGCARSGIGAHRPTYSATRAGPNSLSICAVSRAAVLSQADALLAWTIERADTLSSASERGRQQLRGASLSERSNQTRWILTVAFMPGTSGRFFRLSMVVC